MAFLELKDVGKIYASEGNIAVGIRSVNLSFDRGELVAVTGASGSGKTTLLSVISGMDTYEEGELFIEGAPTSHYTEREREYYREKYISFVFQDYNIIESFTVLENVELALLHIADAKLRRRRALALIERVGLLSEAKQKGSTLSGGQKQRTVIARALAKDSPILLADEPTGNLDAKSAKEIVELLADVAKDKLVIIVTHSLEELLGVATRHIRIFDGGVESDRSLAPRREIEQSEKVPSPEPRRLSLTLRCGMTLGRTLLLAKPRLSVFLSGLLLVGMLAVFLLTSLCRDAGSVFSSPTMFTHIDGRVVVTTRDGSIIPEDELQSLAASLSAKSYLSLDYLLDERQTTLLAIADSTIPEYTPGEDLWYNDFIYDGRACCIYELRYAYGEMPRPDVGRRPQSEREVMLSLPIGYRDFFGKDKLLVRCVTINDLELDLVGVNYYYDNNLSPSCHFTDEGFAYINAVSYLLNEMDTQIMAELNLASGGKAMLGFGSLVPAFGMEKPFYFVEWLDPISAKITLSVTDNAGSGEMLALRTYDLAALDYKAPDALFLTGKGNVIIDAEILLELSREVVPLTYAQASFFFEDDERAESAAKELSALGYVAVPSYVTYSQDSFEVILLLIGALMQGILWLAGTLFVAFFLSVAVTRAMRAFASDVAILRSMGIRSEVIRLAVYVRMLLSMLAGAIAVAIVAVAVFRSPTLNQYFVYLYARHYIAISLGTLLLTLFVTHKTVKNLFGKSVRHTLRGGDVK